VELIERKLEECWAWGVWKVELVGWYSSCGDGKGYSNREDGSNGVPIIADGECNLMPVNGKPMPLEFSFMVVTNSAMTIETGVEACSRSWRFLRAGRSLGDGFKFSGVAFVSSRRIIEGVWTARL